MIVAVLKNGWKVLDFNMKLMIVTIIFDLMEGFVILIYASDSVLNTQQYLKYELGCQICYILLVVFAVTSVNLTSIVALDRYLIIVTGIRLMNKYYILLILFFIVLNTIACITGLYLNGIGILPSFTYCFLKYSNFGGLLSQGIITLSIGISTLLIYFCYIKIMIQRKKQLEEIRELFPEKYNSITRQRNMTIIKSGTLILASSISNAPYCIITVASMIDPSFYTPSVDTIRCTLIIMNMIINSLLLLGMRSDLLTRFRSLLGFKSSTELSNFNSEIELI
jgi:hypothetical protein